VDKTYRSSKDYFTESFNGEKSKFESFKIKFEAWCTKRKYQDILKSKKLTQLVQEGMSEADKLIVDNDTAVRYTLIMSTEEEAFKHVKRTKMGTQHGRNCWTSTT